MILQGLKPTIFKWLDKFRAIWVAELPSVLWSLRTTPCQATGFTPFFMVHGSEAVFLTDTDYGSREYGLTPRKGIKSRSRTRSINSMRRAT
jgi:hypothetical protein